MADEFTELLNIAIDREIASQAFYLAGMKKTSDAGAIALMKDLAAEEQKHYELIKEFKESGRSLQDWKPKKAVDLKLSEYLVETPITEGAMLQDVIDAAMKREQYSIDFYTRMKEGTASQAGKRLCDRLIAQEHGHKKKLELFYDDFFNKEN
jgi:rubrerythrin